MRGWRRFLVEWMGYHGRRHQASRHVSIRRLITMGVGF